MAAEATCSYCVRPISGVIFQCTECTKVCLCLPCFSSGAESGGHKKAHGYRIHISQQRQSIHIFGIWNSEEELSLLDALEHYGVGNWEDVSVKVETKTAVQCMQHYCDYYLNGLLSDCLTGDSQLSTHITDHTQSLTVSPAPVDCSSVQIDIEEQHLLGYMPLRGDFERDYDNDAESILCRLHPSFSHDDLEDALKVAQVGVYVQRLRERQRRKEIAREHGLISYILAFILNKRIKRMPENSTATTTTAKKTQGRRPTTASPNRHRHRPRSLRPLLPYSRQSTNTSSLRTPTRRAGNHRNSLTETTPVSRKDSTRLSPPPDSWLAAPFVRKSSGPSRGTLLITNRLPVLHARAFSATTNTGSVSNSLLKNCTVAAEHRDAFFLNPKLKPFLRYFTGPHGKEFMESLHREEVLKHEIKVLLDWRARGKVKLSDIRLKGLPLKSSIYCAPQKCLQLIPLQPHKALQSKGNVKKRRRHLTTPWYLKVQRKRNRQ